MTQKLFSTLRALSPKQWLHLIVWNLTIATSVFIALISFITFDMRGFDEPVEASPDFIYDDLIPFLICSLFILPACWAALCALKRIFEILLNAWKENEFEV